MHLRRRYNPTKFIQRYDSQCNNREACQTSYGVSQALAAGCIRGAHVRFCTPQTEDGPVKKKRGRGGDDAEADSAPPSKGFSFGAAAPAFGAASKDSKASADAGKAGTEVSMPPGGLSFGASQPFSFGAAATAGSTAAEGKADAKESQPGQDNASSQPAAVPAASQAAALLPASLAFGTRPADAASDGKLNATATPFAPSFDAGSMPSSDISGVQKIVAGGEAGNSQSGPASNAASGLPLVEVRCAVEVDNHFFMPRLFNAHC